MNSKRQSYYSENSNGFLKEHYARNQGPKKKKKCISYHITME